LIWLFLSNLVNEICKNSVPIFYSIPVFLLRASWITTTVTSLGRSGLKQHTMAR
jgi:hypothetical protein